MTSPTTIGRNGAKLDDLVETIVLGYLGKHGVGGEVRNDAGHLNALYDQRKALVEEKGQLGTLFGRHVIDAVQLENATVELKGQIAEIGRRLAEATRISPVAMLLGGDDEQTLHDLCAKALPDIKSRIVRELMDVVVHPAPKGVRTFGPDLIEIHWMHYQHAAQTHS